MGSVVQLSAYRRLRPEPAAAQPTPPAGTVEAEIVILPVVRIVRGDPVPVEAAQG